MAEGSISESLGVAIGSTTAYGVGLGLQLTQASMAICVSAVISFAKQMRTEYRKSSKEAAFKLPPKQNQALVGLSLLAAFGEGFKLSDIGAGVSLPAERTPWFAVTFKNHKTGYAQVAEVKKNGLVVLWRRSEEKPGLKIFDSPMQQESDLPIEEMKEVIKFEKLVNEGEQFAFDMSKVLDELRDTPPPTPPTPSQLSPSMVPTPPSDPVTGLPIGLTWGIGSAASSLVGTPAGSRNSSPTPQLPLEHVSSGPVVGRLGDVARLACRVDAMVVDTGNKLSAFQGQMMAMNTSHQTELASMRADQNQTIALLKRLLAAQVPAPSSNPVVMAVPKPLAPSEEFQFRDPAPLHHDPAAGFYASGRTASPSVKEHSHPGLPPRSSYSRSAPPLSPAAVKAFSTANANKALEKLQPYSNARAVEKSLAQETFHPEGFYIALARKVFEQEWYVPATQLPLRAAFAKGALILRLVGDELSKFERNQPSLVSTLLGKVFELPNNQERLAFLLGKSPGQKLTMYSLHFLEEEWEHRLDENDGSLADKDRFATMDQRHCVLASFYSVVSAKRDAYEPGVALPSGLALLELVPPRRILWPKDGQWEWMELTWAS